MNLEQLQNSGLIQFECVAGSTCYNLNTPLSDVDLRGIYVHPKDDYFTLNEPVMQVSDEKSDILYYELKKFIKLASGCNPNIIELLYIDDEHINIKTPLMDKIIENRDMFISKKCYYTFSAYAHAQIKKCKGQNKWINNPQPKERPDPRDYLYGIDKSKFNYTNYVVEGIENFPFRPANMKSTMNMKVARVEHGFNCYRAYYAPSEDFFKGGKIICKSITKDEERNNFVGLIIFNEVQYEQDVRNWKNYWDWMDKRNEARWVSQEKGDIDYDAKNVMHSMRLIRSTKSILKNGYPQVSFHGEERDFLMKIRNGGFTYDEIIKIVESEMDEIEELKESSNIPYEVNQKDIEQLYKDLMKEV